MNGVHNKVSIMARRKDHSPEALKQLIVEAAEKIIDSKGLDSLTARALAKAIGYAPGTIYNVYRDMDALVTDINYINLGRLQAFCLERMGKLPADFERVRALAYGYSDFAHGNRRAWETIFSGTRKGDKKIRLPKPYQERLADIFRLLEDTLQECLRIPAAEASGMARLLWACMHGITVLTLDGRLSLIGVDDPHRMIDDLLVKYLAAYI
jgi:AcrR family transcriptional regulator